MTASSFDVLFALLSKRLCDSNRVTLVYLNYPQSKMLARCFCSWHSLTYIPLKDAEWLA